MVQCKILVVLDFLHHRHKACIASGKQMVRWTLAASGSPLASSRILLWGGGFEEVAGVSAGSGALHYAKDLFKPEEMVLRSKYPPIFWSRLCESCKIAYFRQFPWVSIKKSSCFLIENAVAWCSVAHSSEKRSLIKSWLPCHHAIKVMKLNDQPAFDVTPKSWTV